METSRRSFLTVCLEVCQLKRARLKVLSWPQCRLDGTGRAVDDQLLIGLLSEAGLQCRWLLDSHWMVVGSEPQLVSWSHEETFTFHPSKALESFGIEIGKLFPGVTFQADAASGTLKVTAPTGLLPLVKGAVIGWDYSAEAVSMRVDNESPVSPDDYASYLEIAYPGLHIESRSPAIVARGIPSIFKRITRDMFDLLA